MNGKTTIQKFYDFIHPILWCSFGIGFVLLIQNTSFENYDNYPLDYEITEKGIEFLPKVFLQKDGCMLSTDDLILRSNVQITNERHYDIIVTWQMNDIIERVIVPRNTTVIDSSFESKGYQCESKILKVERR
jgi:hypothetical protein